MKRIAIDHIETGMLLAEDVHGPDGTIYLGEGTALKERHKILLENLGIHSVAIKEVHTASFSVNKPSQNEANEPPSIDPKIVAQPAPQPIQPQSSPPQSSSPQSSSPQQNTGVGVKKSVSWNPGTAQIIKRNRMYKKTLESFKSIYRDVSFGKPIEFEPVKETLIPLIDEITNENNILENLRRIEIADDYTFRHAIQVSVLATMIGKWMNIPHQYLLDIAVAGLLHDLGKCQVPIVILNKPARLDPEEFEIMKTHVLLSYAILEESGQQNQSILRGVLEHHERIDGSGYPNGLKGDEIHLYAKIIAVADVYDAMTSDRCYQPGVSPFTVAEEMLRIASNHLDVEIVSCFLQNISRFFVGNRVELSNGEMGDVVLVNPYSVSRPLIQLENNYIDLAKRFDVSILRVLK